MYVAKLGKGVCIHAREGCTWLCQGRVYVVELGKSVLVMPGKGVRGCASRTNDNRLSSKFNFLVFPDFFLRIWFSKRTQIMFSYSNYTKILIMYKNYIVVAYLIVPLIVVEETGYMILYLF